jgi:glycosyltransferase involved in cell wall biosynthesis
MVVDKSSPERSPDMVEAEFAGKTYLIHRDQDSPTAGRNQSFNAARGAYILSLDNDNSSAGQNRGEKGPRKICATSEGRTAGIRSRVRMYRFQKIGGTRYR